MGKIIEEREGRDDVKNTRRGNREVISRGPDAEVRFPEKLDQEGVVAQDEEEGGERAALFDTVFDQNLC